MNHGDSRSNPKVSRPIEETESYKFSLDDWEEWVGITDSETMIDDDIDTDSDNDDTDSIMDLELRNTNNYIHCSHKMFNVSILNSS